MNFFMHIIVLQSFVDLGALIITQMPLPDTEEICGDFAWTMIFKRLSY